VFPILGALAGFEPANQPFRKRRHSPLCHRAKYLVASGGLEPPFSGSEPDVLAAERQGNKRGAPGETRTLGSAFRRRAHSILSAGAWSTRRDSNSRSAVRSRTPSS